MAWFITQHGTINQDYEIQKVIKNEPTENKIYSPDVETLWDLRQLYDKRTESDPKFSFSKMMLEIHKLPGEGKVVAASTIRNFYLQRTNPRKNTIKAIQRWID